MNLSKPVSKVLVLDDSPAHAEALKLFFDEHNLIALKVRDSRRLSAVLSTSIDLGGVLLADDYGGSLDEAAAAAARINTLRPELPVILRLSGNTPPEQLPHALKNAACASFDAANMSALCAAVDQYIFSLDFPNALVRGIAEITEARLATLFDGVTVRRDAPSVVRDRIIFGEVFSLIPLEGTWCRGYMLMQAQEDPLLAMIERDRAARRSGANGASGTSGVSGPGAAEAGFRDLNNLLGELTNLIWGAFKDRFLGPQSAREASQVQVPLLVNHKHRYISFGSDNPQLRFQYLLHDETSGQSVAIDQRFVFNLSWSPEDFSENTLDVDDLVESGELDLF
ncbi:chemotaxis protein CheX [Paraburkholderia sp. Ac-20342]|uniref:chemotaxis protein CheX n=1 Tax=Paraburkholderia sp. Ac-20342 TaxID=2703889 RepID=UPI00197EB8F1|nr:chemotaxis protein CheX [Paraburkholderia sp. Ac-20342]MBN3847296.1 chemotaxis protein CheX [Paraburkholderia sp. Ac-20342]